MKTTLKQCLSVFDAVKRQLVLAVAWKSTYFAKLALFHCEFDGLYVHWTIQSHSLSFQVVFLFLSFLVITLVNLKEFKRIKRMKEEDN